MTTDDHRRRLEVTVADTRGRRLRMARLSRWLEHVAPARARGSVSIALLSDRRVRELNRRYRQKDYATDVLSFPACDMGFRRCLAARGESLAAFDERCIPAGCVAPRSNTPGILGRRALPAGRLARLGATPDFHHGLLGDIVIARGIARRQARRSGHAELTELRLLALHGLLHLLGYDHERDDGRMRRLEQRLGRKGGLLKGLIERR